MKIEFRDVVNVMVKDVQGKVIFDASKISEVDMKEWADGIYFFTVSDKDNHFLQTEKVIKISR